MMESTRSLDVELKNQIEARLKTYGYSEPTIAELMHTYRARILEWQHAYLVAGTHVSPDNMADDIVFAEKL